MVDLAGLGILVLFLAILVAVSFGLVGVAALTQRLAGPSRRTHIPPPQGG